MSSTAVLAWEESVRLSGMEPPPRVRPNVLRWLRYVAWGRLPERNRGWVLYDTTCATWAIRHFARLLLLVSVPVAAIAVLLPTEPAIRALTALTTGLCAIMFAGLYINEATDHRLAQAGFPPAIGPQIRETRAIHGQRLANAARRERSLQRRTGRRA
jgi:hypothetical protein